MGLTSWVRKTTVVACALSALAPAIDAAATTAPTPPAPPANVAVVTGNAVAKVSWTEATSNATFTAKAVAANHVTRVCHATTADTCMISSLANGVTYAFSVTAATVKGGTSAPSAVVTAEVGVPGPPRLVEGTAGKVLILVKWSAPTPNGVPAITGYTATGTPGPVTCTTKSTLLAPAARTCALLGLSRHTTYTISVTASNRWGTSIPSKGVTVTTS